MVEASYHLKNPEPLLDPLRHRGERSSSAVITKAWVLFAALGDEEFLSVSSMMSGRLHVSRDILTAQFVSRIFATKSRP